MQLFAGLGNPGPKYAGNRHNVGFMAVDRIAGAHGFAPWRSRFRGLAAEGRLGAERVLLLKPETFMNLSGEAVAAALGFYKLGPDALTVFHDELDLDPGRLRVKTGGGHAGHNGLRSIAARLGPDFRRVRIGIGHPGRKELVSPYVLHDFARADAAWLDPLLDGIAEGAPALAAGDTGRFQYAVARRLVPPDAAPDPAGPAAPPPAAPSGPTDTRSALRRLADRFR